MNSLCLFTGGGGGGGPFGGGWFCCACRFWTVAVRFWISCICAVKNCCIVGSIANSCGGGGTWFSWLTMWARITGAISCPAPDLVFTIWLLGKKYFRKEVELIKVKRKGGKIQNLILIILLMHLWSSLHKNIPIISKIQIMHVYNQQALTSHVLTRTALSKRNWWKG
jgi:hypothetical protein